MPRFPGFACAAALVFAAASADAQWLKQKTAGIPRTADGKPNLTAPAPRTHEGKPDLSGLWRYVPDPYTNVAADLKPDDVKPSVVELYKQRMEDLGKDDPSTFRCLPSGPRVLFAPAGYVRVIQTPTTIAMLYEDLIYRVIFMDGRELPKDPNPSYMGYSVGRWDGDTLVIDSLGFNDATWLDFVGHPHTEALRMTERIKRGSFGRLDVEVRLDDPTLYKRAWTVPVHAEIVPDTETLEYVCNENQKDTEHLVGKLSDEKKLSVKVDPKIMSAYVGSYTFVAPDDPNQKSHFNVTLNGDVLSFDFGGGKDKQEMVALSDTTFSVMGVRLDFVADKGVTSHLIFHIVEGDMKATKDK
jgi:hypothetical protein